MEDPRTNHASVSLVGTALVPLLLFVTTLLIYIPSAAQGSVTSDSHSAAAGAWRIASTGRPWMEGVDTEELRGTYATDWLVPGADGHLVFNRTAGVVLPIVPFYWFLNNDPAAAEFAVGVAGIAAACYAALAGLLLFLALRKIVAQNMALAVTAVVEFATPMWTVSANAMWTHTVTQLAFAGTAWALSRSNWVLVGMFMGVGILARPHLAVAAAVLGLGMAFARRDWKVAIKVAAPTLLFLCLLTAWNRVLFGEFSIRGGYESYVVSNATSLETGLGSYFENWLGFLFSPDRGLIVWTPALALVLPAVFKSWKSVPDWTRWLAISGVAYTAIQMKINSFGGGEGFYAYRHGLELLVCLAPVVAASFARVGRTARLWLGPLLAAQLGAFYLGANSDHFFVVSEDVWRDNSFWWALRVRPSFVGVYIGIFVLAGTAASMFLSRRWTLGRSRVAGSQTVHDEKVVAAPHAQPASDLQSRRGKIANRRPD